MKILKSYLITLFVILIPSVVSGITEAWLLNRLYPDYSNSTIIRLSVEVFFEAIFIPPLWPIVITIVIISIFTDININKHATNSSFKFYVIKLCFIILYSSPIAFLNYAIIVAMW